MSNKPNTKKTNRSKVKAQEEVARTIYSKPVWNGSDSFVISGRDFQELINTVAPYRALIELTDRLLQTGELAGTVRTDYVWQDSKTGEMVSVPRDNPRRVELEKQKDEELAKMRKQLEEYTERLREQQEATAKELEKAAKAAGGTVEKKKQATS